MGASPTNTTQVFPPERLDSVFPGGVFDAVVEERTPARSPVFRSNAVASACRKIDLWWRATMYATSVLTDCFRERGQYFPLGVTGEQDVDAFLRNQDMGNRWRVHNIYSVVRRIGYQ